MPLLRLASIDLLGVGSSQYALAKCKIYYRSQPADLQATQVTCEPREILTSQAVLR